MSFNLIANKISTKKLVGFIDKKLPKLDNSHHLMKLSYPYEEIVLIDNLLQEKEIEELTHFFFDNKRISTGRKTIKLVYGQEKNGIQRSSFYDKDFAVQLSERINQYLVQQEKGLELIGVNPLIRFIQYKENQRLIPHYDIAVNLNERVTTLKTLIIYLNNAESGHTNFLKDNRVDLKVDSFETYPILFKQKPEKGLGLIFNHGVFHEGGLIKKNDTKLIITTEICYKKN